MGGYLYGSFGGKEGDNDTIINEVVFEKWERLFKILLKTLNVTSSSK